MIRKLINSIFGKIKINKPNEISSKQTNHEERELLLKKIQDYSLSTLLGKSRAVNIIVIHRTSSNGREIHNLGDAELFFKDVFGKKIVYSNNYIPYHFIVTSNGVIYDTLPLSSPAICVSGHLNDAISISYIDENGDGSRSEEQKESISWLVSSLNGNLGVNTVISDNENIDNDYK